MVTGRETERARVLVVEDDAQHARDLAELLTGRFEVGIAQDAETALRVAPALKPDAVLLDLGLPDRDGLEVLETLLGTRDTQDFPVLVYSGRSDERTTVRTLELGAADFVAKPSSGGELVARLERAIRQGRTERALKRLAQTDALTGLANYGALQTRLSDEVKRSRRYRHALSAVVIDLDFLKTINDQLGHEAGNRAIVALANHLRRNLRETDFAARFGGDEFVVLLPYQSEDEAKIFAERVRSSLADVRVLNERGEATDVRLSLSAGVAALLSEEQDADEKVLMDRADAALYEAKRRGRNCAVAFRAIAGNQLSQAAH